MSKGIAGKKAPHPYVAVDPKTGKESPVVKGTRIKVMDIALRYELIGMTPDQIVERFPHLTLAQVHDALSYYYEHKDELDRMDRMDQVIIAELKRHYPSKLKTKLG
jgi:uncharacterized protein (DUF433 family)